MTMSAYLLSLGLLSFLDVFLLGKLPLLWIKPALFPLAVLAFTHIIGGKKAIAFAFSAAIVAYLLGHEEALILLPFLAFFMDLFSPQTQAFLWKNPLIFGFLGLFIHMLLKSLWFFATASSSLVDIFPLLGKELLISLLCYPLVFSFFRILFPMKHRRIPS